MSLGRFGEAEKAFLDAIAIQERVHKTREHADVAASLHGLANVLVSLGRFGEAEKAYLDSIAITERVYKTREHADIAASLHGLANVLVSLGRFGEAETSFREVIRIEEEVFGSRSTPNTLPTLNQLAQLLLVTDRPEEALPWARETWEGALEARLVIEAVQSGPTLMKCLAALGKEEQVREVGGQVAALLSQLPPDHPVRKAVEGRIGPHERKG
jgi:tetratricopeptide (TPR) repeat protein